MRGLFVTATDTGVGKTEVACALLRGHRARGLDVVAMKPAQSGHAPGEPSDAERLAGGRGRRRAARARLPVLLRRAARAGGGGAARGEDGLAGAPSSARRRALADAPRGARSSRAPAASWRRSPTRESYADLAVALGLPVLVVARAGLGTVNHTALTCEALRSRGLAVHGVVLNRTCDPWQMRPSRTTPPRSSASPARASSRRSPSSAISLRASEVWPTSWPRKSNSRPLGAGKWIDRAIDPRDRRRAQRRRSTPSAPRPAAPSTVSSTRAGSASSSSRAAPAQPAPRQPPHRVGGGAGPAPGARAPPRSRRRLPHPPRRPARAHPPPRRAHGAGRACSARSGHFRSAGHQRKAQWMLASRLPPSGRPLTR